MSTRPRGPRPAPDGPSWIHGGRIPCLDGLRALAILLVLFSHLEFPGGDRSPLRFIHGRCGFLGVQIFFVLSGFLITTLLLREVARDGRLNLRGFYWCRFLRIVHVYLVFLAAVLVLQLCRQASLDGRAWFSLTTYTVNFLPGGLPYTISHVWSLSVEEHFYLVWPLLLAFWPLARCRQAALASVAAALGLRWLMLLTSLAPGRPVDLWTVTRGDDIAVGCLLAFAARDPLWRGRLDWFTADGRRMALVVAAFLTSQLLCSRQGGAVLFPAVVVKLLVGVANDANSFTIALFLWALTSRPAGPGARALNHPAARFVGLISYSLYLWHPLFIAPGRQWLFPFPLNLLCLFAAAVLSYWLVEKPLLALKGPAGEPRTRPTSALAPSPAAPVKWPEPQRAPAAPLTATRPVTESPSCHASGDEVLSYGTAAME